MVLASRRSVGVEVSHGDRTLKVKALEHYDFSDVDICLMLVAEPRRAERRHRCRRRGRDRQFLRLADGSGRAADRA